MPAHVMALVTRVVLVSNPIQNTAICLKDIKLLILEPSRPDHEGMNIRFTWSIGDNGSVESKQYTIRDASIDGPYEFNMDRRGMCHNMFKGTLRDWIRASSYEDLEKNSY